jgi:CBS domain-containing protein
VLAFVLGFLGLIGGGPLMVFVALFVWLGAAAENHAVALRDVARGLIAEDAMITKFETLAVSATVADAAECLIRTSQTEFPVVDGGGRLRGILTRSHLVRALRESGPGVPVLDAMQADVPVVPHRMPLEQAMQAMQQAGGPIGVVDGTGRLVGLLTQENLGEMMLVQAARASRAPANPWARGA